MEDGKMPTEGQFQDALLSELGVTPDTPPEPPVTPPVEPPVTPPVEPPVTPPTEPPVEKTEEEKAAEAEAELVKNEKPEETAARHEAEAAAKAVEDAPKPLTKEDIAELLDTREKTVAGRTTEVKEASQKVIETMYPEGLDTKIYDTNGKVIETAQDIVDRGLINDRTGEAYTYEEAASFMLEAGRKMAENVQELNQYAEAIAEKNVSLKEGNDRVMAKWGETLKGLPDADRKMLAETFLETLTFDKSNSYITDMKLSPERFYDLALTPYARLNAQRAEQAEQQATADAEAARLAAEAEAAAQAERNGSIPPQRGTSDVKANTGDPMLDALVDELAKK